MRKFALAAALAATLSSPALAVDFTATIKSMDGTAMTKADKSTLTLEEVVTTALLSSYQDEGNLDGAQKSQRFWLAMKIHDKPVDPVLTSDEIALIKKLVAKAYNPLVVGRAWTILDPATVPK